MSGDLDYLKEEVNKLESRFELAQKEFIEQAAIANAQFKAFQEHLQQRAEDDKETREIVKEAIGTFNQVKSTITVLIFLGGIISTLLTVLITVGDFFG
jgi:heme oxygenase